jgi:hypothetical protein
MATCKKCKCDTKYCGCADKAITVSPPCGQDTLYCPAPEQCPETFSAGCVVYTGDTIIDLNIEKGERMDVIMQKLALWITNPNCIDGIDVCQAVVGLRSASISSSMIKIKWEPGYGAAAYTVEWKLASSLTWDYSSVALTPSPNPEYLLTGLAANSEYYIRVKNLCTAVAPNPAEVCYSVTISVTTLA